MPRRLSRKEPAEQHNKKILYKRHYVPFQTSSCSWHVNDVSGGSQLLNKHRLSSHTSAETLYVLPRGEKWPENSMAFEGSSFQIHSRMNCFRKKPKKFHCWGCRQLFSLVGKLSLNLQDKFNPSLEQNSLLSFLCVVLRHCWSMMNPRRLDEMEIIFLLSYNTVRSCKKSYLSDRLGPLVQKKKSTILQRIYDGAPTSWTSLKQQ